MINSSASIVSISAEVEMLRQDIIKLSEQATHFKNYSQNNNDHELYPFINDVNAFVDFFEVHKKYQFSIAVILFSKCSDFRAYILIL